MSHTTKHGEKITDVNILLSKVEEVGGTFQQFSTEENVNLYGHNKVRAVARIKLPGWRYGIAIDKDGFLHYDHFGSEAGSMETFHKVLVEYKHDLITDSIPMDADYWHESINDAGEKVIEVFYQ